MSEEARRKASSIKLLAFDVDGVLTTGAIILSARGEEMKEFSVRDGLGIKVALEAGLEIAVVSSRESDIVSARCRELGIEHTIQGAGDKVSSLRSLASSLGIDSSEAAFLGDDLVDLGAMKWAGLGVSVADACDEVIEAADMVTAADGGYGAARETIEFVLKSQGLWKKTVERMFGAEK